jgi:hypothetical protein
VTSLLAAASLPAERDDDERTARLWDAVDQDFLAIMGWDPGRQVVSFPQDHPLLGWRACPVLGCHNWARSGTGPCYGCANRWAATEGVSPADFAAMPKPFPRCIGVVQCAVGGCQRPAKTTRGKLCTTHDYQRRHVICLPLEEFLAHPDVIPLASFGPCRAPACTRDRVGRGPHCNSHYHRLKMAKKKDPDLDIELWERTVPTVTEGSQVSLRAFRRWLSRRFSTGCSSAPGRTSRPTTLTSVPYATCCATQGPTPSPNWPR